MTSCFQLNAVSKPLFFFESTVDEKETYKGIKKHNFQVLCNKIQDKSGLKILEQSIIDNGEIYDVSSRYTLEANINFREEHILGLLYHNTIGNFVWLDKLYKIAKDLLDFVESKNPVVFEVINFQDMDIDWLTAKSHRIKNISKPLSDLSRPTGAMNFRKMENSKLI